MKKMPGYMSCYTNVPKIMIKWSYTKLFLRYKAWQMQFLFFILGYFLPFSPLTTQKNKLKQIWRKKTHLEVSSFYTCVPKIVITMVPKKYGARRMDRQTGGQKKWHIAMSVSPKKLWQVWKSPFQFSDKFGHVTC